MQSAHSDLFVLALSLIVAVISYKLEMFVQTCCKQRQCDVLTKVSVLKFRPNYTQL